MHKGQYQCHMAAWAAHTTHLLTTQKNKKQEPHRRAYLSENGGLRKTDQNGPKAENEKTYSDRIRQKNKRGAIEKWDQTGSLEIPDRGETSDYRGHDHSTLKHVHY